MDRVMEVLLIALLLFCPVAFGAVHAWSEEVVLLLAAALSLVFLLKLVVVRSTPFVWSWTYVPVAVFVLAAVVQLLPLPPAVVGVISPHTAAIKTELLADLPEPENAPAALTLSFYPRATKHDLRLVLAVAAVFIVVVNVYRQPPRIKRLLTAVAGIGGAMAFLALVQDVAGNGKIYGFVPTYDQASSGTFINHSHYGQFMNLSIGAALGLLFVTLHEVFAGRHVTPGRVTDYLSSPSARFVKLLIVFTIVGAATVFLSLTRGGMISLLIAGGFTTMMLSWRQSLKGRGWIIVLLALGAFICVLYVGFDQVYERLAALRDFHQEQRGRLQIVQDIALAWTKFPVLGVGLGTHEVVYPMFDRSTSAALAMHAENEYAQLAEETGLVGLVALLFFGVLVWRGYGRAINHVSVPICSAAYGLGFGLLAILIHSLSDFGQHLPANALLSAVFSGLLIVLAHGDRRRESRATARPGHGGAAVWPSLLLVLVGGLWGWALRDANRATIAEANWNQVLIAEHHLNDEDWRAPPAAYDYLFTYATKAALAEPDNIQYQHWLSVYKWLWLTPQIDPNTGQLPPETLPWVKEIVQELHAARPLCPTFGATCCMAGELEQFVLGDPNGAERIRKGYRLAPCDPAACLALARVEALEGRLENARDKLARAVQLDGQYFQRAARLCIDDLGRSDLALQLAGNDTSQLSYVANLLASSGKAGAPAVSGAAAPAGGAADQPLAAEAERKAFERLKVTCAAPDAPAFAHASLANLYYQYGDLEAAIRHYRRAVQLNYGEFSWHHMLAVLLAKVDRIDEANHEARISLRIRPDYAPAQQFLEALAGRSSAAPLQAGSVTPTQGR